MGLIQPSQIIKQNRRTISITVTKIGEVIVKAPINCPDSEIYRFVSQKQSWIIAKLNQINTLVDKNINLMQYKTFLLFGKEYPSVITDSVKSVKLENGTILLPHEKTMEQIVHKVVLYYKKQAKIWLNKRAVEISEKLKLPFSAFKISNTQGRWGACNTKKEININFRVVCLPASIIDYIIVHELIHLLEMNHSPVFWSKVASILPDFKARRQQLKNYGFLLKIF